MAYPAFRLTCCLCGRLIPKSSDVYALDGEWRRRHPQLVGSLACDCAVADHYWVCAMPGEEPVPGHIPLDGGGECEDSWHHIQAHGTPIGMVLFDPRSGFLQGAADYLRAKASDLGPDSSLSRALRAVADERPISPVLAERF